VHLSDEALSGLGTASQFLRYTLFGAIIQIYDPPPRTSTSIQHPTHVTRPPEDILYNSDEPSYLTYEDHDPHIPIKPARRKALAPDPSIALEEEQSDERKKLSLTDLVPNVGYFAAGGLSGITSRTATAPLDRLKVYLIAQTGTATEAIQAAKKGAALQATKHGASTIWNACKDLWAAGGLRSLFAGM
jgi:solute carrier family 25 phosphate transporter 23/24/25/41